MKKILFVPDVISSNDSGARSASYTVKILLDMGYNVAIYASDIDSNKFKKANNFIRSHFSMIQHFLSSSIKNEFQKVLSVYKPNYVFFAGGTINKPLAFYSICIKKRIPFVFIDYCASYFCLKIFSGTKSGPCHKCINGNFFNAAINNCTDRQKNKYIYLIIGSIVLFRFRKILKHTHGAIGYGKTQLNTYESFGIPKNKLYDSSVFIETKGIALNDASEVAQEDFFLIYGQQRVIKGWHFLNEIFRKCSKIKFKIAIHDGSKSESVINQWNLEEFISNGQLEILKDLDWDGLKNNIYKSKGIILPSIWSTTGEFSLIEALGAGKPVVTFNVGFHSDYLRNKQNAMVAEVGDLDIFSENIIKLSKDTELSKKISLGALETFKHITSLDRHKFLFKKLFK